MRGKIMGAYPAYNGKRHRIVLFNANTSELLPELLPIRRWPKEHYVRLGGMILDLYADVVILLTGGAGEHAWLEALASRVRSERCINFAGRTALTELPALYSLSAFMLSNDSGPPHFASVTGMPTFVFFGPETPNLYRPLGGTTPFYAGMACSPCVSAANHRKTACNDNVCLQIISPEQVFGVLKPKLDGTL
jgi:ADP-heptose:LPS heptosyltransferase